MKEIYKILISVFTILMLASSIGIAAKPTPTPTPTPTPNQEQIQDSRLTSLETKDTLQQINNTEQQGLINGLIRDVNTIKNQIISLTDQISQLLNRVINLENNQSSIYMKYYDGYNPINGTYTEVTNFTFYLPKDSYVYVESSGQLLNFLNRVDVVIGMDTNINGDQVMSYFYDCNSSNPYNWNCFTGFQISYGYYLSSGYHTIHLGAANEQNLRSGPDNPIIGQILITVMANTRGTLQREFGPGR